uniref:Tetratricopeptide repeat (TPR)-like superfamily protein n=1 Tax=Heterorhabditis bacteriophora TaxID=37862 RepID=A0A1I7XDG7_HETBA
MLQPVVQMTRYALLYKNSMYSSMRTLSYVQCWYRKNRERTNSDHSKTRSKWSVLILSCTPYSIIRFDGWIKAGAPVLGISWLVTIKDILGIEPLKLDKDPLKEKIKQSWLHRKYGRYREATQVLQIALEEAEERSEQLPITRYNHMLLRTFSFSISNLKFQIRINLLLFMVFRVYDELANTYYLMGDLNEAENLTKLHGKRDDDAEFIGVSLKLADILAMKGFLDSAEAGYKHCVKKQMHVMEEHMKKYSVAHGALVEDKHLVDTHGAFYSDPIALFGMALETYAHFLVTYRDETRLQEAEEYMDEVMKISYQIFGANSFHTINLLNNFGAVLIQKNRFELAAKYLGIGIERILYVNECASIIPGYYCNYAEALFHTGKKSVFVDSSDAFDRMTCVVYRRRPWNGRARPLL